MLPRLETDWTFEYSPESFTGTEVEFAVEISEAVMEVWEPTPQRTIHSQSPGHGGNGDAQCLCGPNRMVLRHFKTAIRIIFSVHTHNDRGTGVAATELAVLAGADGGRHIVRQRRTHRQSGHRDRGAQSLHARIDPKLDFSNINETARAPNHATVAHPPAAPYVGELVFTAFSGSHQDAIRKGLTARERGAVWDVPYLTIDPLISAATMTHHSRQQPVGQGRRGYLLERDYQIVPASQAANRVQSGRSGCCRYQR